ncbi:MAG: protein secretion system (Wss), protein YukD [Frankiaceae bacterium]|jgi:hypothetical protein|nr:protein secretion system (Wss), protein YukD [Frankiaceae bacterium]MDQ1698610.1 protein secretion system (Wss), protein YukD [Frankiaceae bacterium]
MRGRRVRLLTVRGPGGTADFVAAADASLLYLRQLFVDVVGGGELPADSPRWNLYDYDNRPLSLTGTLVDQRIVDGDVLRLSYSGAPKDDIEESA